MNFFAKVILGSVVVLLFAAAVVLLFRSREAASVEALIRDAVGWAERGEADRVEALIDDKFESTWGGAEAARREIRRRIRPGAFQKIEVAALEVGVDGDSAHARLTLRILTPEVPLAVPEALSLSLRRRDGAWRVTKAEREDPGDRLRR